MSEQFNEQTMLGIIQANLDDGYTSLENIQNDVNNDYWIIGTYKASQALGEFGTDDELAYDTALDSVFGAIQYVQAFEEDLGEHLTSDMINPEEIANTIAYINMDYTINDIIDHFDYDFGVNDELTDQQVKAIKSLTINDLK